MKKIFLLLALLISCTSLMAEPIGERRARQIAEEFFAEHTTRTSPTAIGLEWAGSEIGTPTPTGLELDNALLYIYNRGTNDGFVVVAGDSNVTPIIAYSLDTTLDTQNMAEATQAILDAWCRQVADARRLAKPLSHTTTQRTTRASDELLYNTAIWNQYEPYNLESPIYDGYRSVTGCVATAMSIICYYNRWPERGVGTTPAYSYTDPYGVNRSVAANRLGRSYNYDNMLMDYNSGYTTTQGDAVAALMKDMGTSVKMMYHYSGSGAYDMDVISAFSTYFGYAKDIELAYRQGYSLENWNEILKENLRNYGPTYFSGQSNSGGHAFVVDGYDTNDMFHFNFGWGGYGNGYFYVPDIDYYIGQAAILYLRPDKDGSTTYRDNLKLYAFDTDGYNYRGIVCSTTSFNTGSSFQCLLGTFYNMGTRAFYGDIALALCSKDNEVKEFLWSTYCDGLPQGYIIWWYPMYVTINSIIKEGDRLRILYKSYDSTEWQWMRSYDYSTTIDEIILLGSLDDIAKNLSLKYDKEGKMITFNSPIPLDLRIEDNATGSPCLTDTIPSNKDYNLSVANMEAGAYKFLFTSGENTYSIVIKL